MGNLSFRADIPPTYHFIVMTVWDHTSEYSVLAEIQSAAK